MDSIRRTGSGWEQSHRSTIIAVSLVSQVVLASSAGINCISRQWVIAFVLMFADMIAMYVFFKAARLTFGSPDMLPAQYLAELLLFGGAVAVTWGPLPFIADLPLSNKETLNKYITVIVGICQFPIFLNGGRRSACLIVAVIMLMWSTRIFMEAETAEISETASTRGNIGAAAFQMGWCFFLASYTRYVRDQHLIMIFAMFKAMMITFTGNVFLGDPLRSGSGAVLTPLFLYAFTLWLRRSRKLPAGLAGAKFVRLGYLRKLVKEGKPLPRCQELPEEAFGDPQKAFYLIIISHRWLDRYKCDTPTEEFPGGLRVITMLNKLNSYFSLAGFRCGNIKASLIGGWDVLVFFDFMCLPQIGQSPDGLEILRTPEEERVFQKCLPNMGALYSFFPVMILDQVAPGLSPYDKSGWCFSEVMIATLGKQLHPYSSSYRPADSLSIQLPTDPIALSSAKSVEEFMGKVNEELATKIFFNPADRDCVRGIVSDFLAKRRLVDSIIMGDKSEVSNILMSLPPQRQQNMLDQAVDKTLNTPLHLAVQRGHSEVVKTLMQYGADPHTPNLWGDMPTQRFCFPRVNQAARVCRKTPIKKRVSIQLMSTPTSHGGKVDPVVLGGSGSSAEKPDVEVKVMGA